VGLHIKLCTQRDYYLHCLRSKPYGVAALLGIANARTVGIA